MADQLLVYSHTLWERLVTALDLSIILRGTAVLRTLWGIGRLWQ
jgi:hypothetical protein